MTKSQAPRLSWQHVGAADPLPQGICGISITLAAAINWFNTNEVAYVKRLAPSKMRNVTFINDCDGYWTEIVQANLLKQFGGP
ncbi:MAG TPA: hypothetical protein VF797_20975 [Noviherbaspirillum sp.]